MNRYHTTWTLITWTNKQLDYVHGEALRVRRAWWRHHRRAFGGIPWGNSVSGAQMVLGSPADIEARLPALPAGGAARLWPITDAQYERSVEVLGHRASEAAR